MMSPPPRMRHHFLLSTTTMLILVMNSGRNANGQDQPEVQTDNNTYGLGEHKLNTKDGTTTVTLADGFRELKAEDATTAKLENYEGSGRGKFKGCNVTKDDNFFIVHYDSNATKDGCAVDFIISKDAKNKNKDVTSQIQFIASVKDKGECLDSNLDCGTGINAERWTSNENIVPFIFSQNNAKVEQLLHKGPIYTDKDNTCKKGLPSESGCDRDSLKKQCINFTALEIRWTKCNSENTLKGYLHQVGEPIMNGRGVANPKEGTNEMGIFGKAVENGNGASFESLHGPMCINNGEAGIPVPKAWLIDNKDFKDSHLFVFQLLPQSATRIYDDIGRMTDQPPASAEGTPKCKGLFIKFPTQVYSAILMPPTTMTTTITTTEAATTTSTMIVPSTTASVNSNKSPSPPTATQSEFPLNKSRTHHFTPSTTTTMRTTTTTTMGTTTTTATETTTTTTTEAPEPEPDEEDPETPSPANDGMDLTTILLITAAALIIIIALIIVIICCICRRRKKTQSQRMIESHGGWNNVYMGVGLQGTPRKEEDTMMIRRQTKRSNAISEYKSPATSWDPDVDDAEVEEIYKDMDLNPQNYWEDDPNYDAYFVAYADDEDDEYDD